MSRKTKVPVNKLLIAALLLAVTFGPQLFAYQQGTFFLFDIRDKASESGSAGRIFVAASVFKSKVKPGAQVAGQDKPSEFEKKITSLKTESKTTDVIGIDISESEPDKPKAEPTFGEPTFGESSFGEGPTTQGGFYFNY